MALALATGSALLVAFDPVLSELVPRAWWSRLWLEHAPLRATPVALLALLITWGAWRVAQSLGGYRRTFVFSIFLAAQTNALRLGPLDVFDVLTAVFFLTWAADQLVSAEQPVVLTGMLFLGAAILAMDLPLLAIQPPVRFLIGFLGLAKVLLVAFVFVNVVHTASLLRFAVRMCIAAALLSALVAVGQFCLSYFGGIHFTFIHPPEEAFKPTPLGFIMRASGLSVTAQHVSGYILLALPFMLFAWSHAAGRQRRRLAAGVVLALAGIVATWNYGAFLVTACVLLLFPLLRWRDHLLQILLAYATLGLVAHYSGFLELLWDLSFGDSGVAKGADQRMALMSYGFEKLWRDPWVGTGLRDMATFSGNYWGRPVHNAYLQAMTEIGLAAGLALIALLLILGTQLLLTAARSRPAVPNLAAPAALVVIALALLMMSEPMLDHSNTWLFLGLAQSVLLVGRGRAADEEDGTGATAGGAVRTPAR